MHHQADGFPSSKIYLCCIPPAVSYVRFQQEVFHSVAATLPLRTKAPVVLKLVAERWHQMSDIQKQPYRAAHLAEKEAKLLHSRESSSWRVWEFIIWVVACQSATKITSVYLPTSWQLFAAYDDLCMTSNNVWLYLELTGIMWSPWLCVNSCNVWCWSKHIGKHPIEAPTDDAPILTPICYLATVSLVCSMLELVCAVPELCSNVFETIDTAFMKRTVSFHSTHCGSPPAVVHCMCMAYIFKLQLSFIYKAPAVSVLCQVILHSRRTTWLDTMYGCRTGYYGATPSKIGPRRSPSLDPVSQKERYRGPGKTIRLRQVFPGSDVHDEWLQCHL